MFHYVLKVFHDVLLVVHNVLRAFHNVVQVFHDALLCLTMFSESRNDGDRRIDDCASNDCLSPVWKTGIRISLRGAASSADYI